MIKIFFILILIIIYQNILLFKYIKQLLFYIYNYNLLYKNFFKNFIKILFFFIFKFLFI